MSMQQLKTLSGGSWMPLVAVLLLLVVVAVGGYFALTLNADIAMPATGYHAMALGAIFSIILGVGLMTLVFVSSRRGYDEAPQREDKGDGYHAS
jgi:hypothetical protein